MYVSVCLCVCVCDVVYCRHMFLCRNTNKTLPPVPHKQWYCLCIVLNILILFSFTASTMESAFFFHSHTLQTFSIASVLATVQLFVVVTQVQSGWLCACSKWCSCSHSCASCSPVPPWLCTEGVDGIQTTSPWRFGMTGNTNYCWAASITSSSLSFTCKHTHLSEIIMRTVMKGWG